MLTWNAILRVKLFGEDIFFLELTGKGKDGGKLRPPF